MQYMQHLMEQDRLVYQAIISDIHHHGRVLEKKFLYLKYSYLVLLFGLGISSVVIFLELTQRYEWFN